MSNSDPPNPTNKFSESDKLFEDIFRVALSEKQKTENAGTPVTKTDAKKPQEGAEKTRVPIKKPLEAPAPIRKTLPLPDRGAETKKVVPKKPGPLHFIKILIPVLLIAGAAAVAIFLLPHMKSPDLLTPAKKPSFGRREMPPDPPSQTPGHTSAPSAPAVERAEETTRWMEDIPSIDKATEVETTKETETNKEEDGAETGADLKTIGATSYPYSVYLGSFRRKDVLERALEIYRAKRLTPYPVRMDLGPKGVWFRVFAGYFKTREEAEVFIKKHQIPYAESRNTRYAVLIDSDLSREAAVAKVSTLASKGCHPYTIGENLFYLRVYTGAFYREEDARTELAWLASKGVTGTIVER